MIHLFERMFGNLFWHNTVFEVTRWHFDERSEKNRKERGESEEKWKKDWNRKFHNLFDIEVSLLFIILKSPKMNVVPLVNKHY